MHPECFEFPRQNEANARHRWPPRSCTKVATPFYTLTVMMYLVSCRRVTFSRAHRSRHFEKQASWPPPLGSTLQKTPNRGGKTSPAARVCVCVTSPSVCGERVPLLEKAFNLHLLLSWINTAVAAVGNQAIEVGSSGPSISRTVVEIATDTR